MVLLALIAGTFISEDLASISAGLLVREGRLGFAQAVAACALGILLGDVGLWMLGRLSGSALGRWPALARYAGRLPVADVPRWPEEHWAFAILASRVMPGTRLPLYVGAGIFGMPLRRFTVWAAVAVLVWTPFVVWVTATAGDAVLRFVPMGGLSGWAVRLAFVAFLFVVVRAWGRFSRSRVHRFSGSRAVTSRLARWGRWEFWPMWVFYAPVAIWVLWLSLRHRGISTITASNPGIPDGGVVGESKFRILSNLPAEWTIPSAWVAPGPGLERMRRTAEIIRERGWSFPIVLKPDVGQRGVGVRLARSVSDVEAYCAGESGAILVQPYDPGPFEAGIFYYRLPGQSRGRIFSITDKQFPRIIGDGRSTIEALIWEHPRYRLQARTFLSRHRYVHEVVLARGEVFQLAIAGNHAQGTLFRDGSHLWTSALEARIDEIAQSYAGFFVGRFDVRYADVERFRAGERFAIVELNGATAESTDIYDPRRSLASAYRTLFAQWSIVFAIGAANKAAGAPVTDARRLVRLLHTYSTSKPAFPVSD
jgi:membrane protein DedA with SNARE-associated domain